MTCQKQDWEGCDYSYVITEHKSGVRAAPLWGSTDAYSLLWAKIHVSLFDNFDKLMCKIAKVSFTLLCLEAFTCFFLFIFFVIGTLGHDSHFFY